MILFSIDYRTSFIDIEQGGLDEVGVAYYYQAWICYCLRTIYEIRWFDDTGCIDSGLL
jgi:hypothetical protein